MNIESVRYKVDSDGKNVGIFMVEDGVTRQVPLDPANRHYAEIMRQVDTDELTIQEAE
jgi:hypothetical protein